MSFQHQGSNSLQRGGSLTSQIQGHSFRNNHNNSFRPPQQQQSSSALSNNHNNSHTSRSLGHSFGGDTGPSNTTSGSSFTAQPISVGNYLTGQPPQQSYPQPPRHASLSPYVSNTQPATGTTPPAPQQQEQQDRKESVLVDMTPPADTQQPKAQTPISQEELPAKLPPDSRDRMLQALADRLSFFYVKQNVEKSRDDIGKIMKSFEGEELILIQGMIDKYGDDGTFTDLQEVFATEAAARGGVSTAARKRSEAVKVMPAAAAPAMRTRATSLFEDMNPHLEESYWSLNEALKQILVFNPVDGLNVGAGPALGGGNPDDTIMTPAQFVTVVTEFQHSAKSFLQDAKHIVDYSRQRQMLEEVKLQNTSSEQQNQLGGGPRTPTSPGGSGVAQPRAPSPTNFMVTARGAHYHRYDLQDTKNGTAGVSGGGASSGGPSNMMEQNPTMNQHPGLRSAVPTSRGISADGTASNRALATEKEMTDGDIHAKVVSTARSDRVVIDVVPMDERPNVLADIIKHKAKPGDVIVLHPGSYRENIVLGASADLEIRPSSNRDDSSVTIYPANPNMPIVQLDADANLRLSGVSLQEPQRTAKELDEWTKGEKKKRATGGIGAISNTMNVPLISVSQASKCDLRAVSLLGGTGGVLVFGNGNVAMTQCTLRKAAFAAVYCKDSAFASASNCHFINCEVALRVRDGTFSVQHCEMRHSSSDAVALHGTCKGVIERCTISDSGDNGVILSPSCEVLLQGSVIERSAMWGVYAPNGADFALVHMGFDANGMGDTSKAPPSQSTVTRFGEKPQ